MSEKQQPQRGAADRDDDARAFTRSDLESRANIVWQWGVKREVVAAAAREWADAILGPPINGHAGHNGHKVVR